MAKSAFDLLVGDHSPKRGGGDKMWCSNCGNMQRLPKGSYELHKSGLIFSGPKARHTTDPFECGYCKGEWLFTSSESKGQKYARRAQEWQQAKRKTKPDDYGGLRKGFSR